MKRGIQSIQQLLLASKPKPWKPEKPIVIQFPINDICNAKCQMCNIWQQKLDYQISPQELETALSNPLFSEVKTVGINGGEPTLRKDIGELTEVLFKTLPKLQRVSLITNALQSKTVINRIKTIGQIAHDNDGELDVMVSLDGVGEVHDRVRGRPGNFENATKVIDFIQNSELVKNKRLGCTVIRENVYGVHDLLEFALRKNIYVKYRIGIPHQRLYSDQVSVPFGLTFEEKYHFVIFLENLIKYYEPSLSQQFFYRSLIGQLIYNLPRQAGCDWQHRGATLTARGELLYCAVESNTLGSAIEQDASELYFGNEAHLGEIVRTKCDSCMHDYVGLPPRQALLRSYSARGLKKVGINYQAIKQNSFISSIDSIRHQANFRRRLRSLGVANKLELPSSQAKNLASVHTQEYSVLICGWYGTETLGDKAILGGVIHALQNALGDIKFHIVSLEEYISQMTALQMPELGHSEIHSVKEAINLIDTCDLVVFAGGPLMAIPPMADMLAIFQKAARHNVPTLLAGCGVGPMGDKYYNQAIADLLASASARIYRDKQSLLSAKSLGIDTSQDLVAEDPAMTWLKNELNNSSRQEVINLDGSRLLLGLRDWPYKQYAHHLGEKEGQQIKERFEAEVLAALTNVLNEHPDLEIIPFPMCTNHIGGDDRWFYHRLFRNAQNLHDNINFDYLKKELTPYEALDLFRSATSALTMRFHSLVFAVASGLPAVSLDYTLGKGKVYSLAHAHNVPNFSLVDLNRKSLSASILEQLQQSRASSLDHDLLFEQSVEQLIAKIGFKKAVKK